MPFWSYKSVSDVGNAFQIAGEKKEFLRPMDVSVSEGFRAELRFVLQEVYFNNSEFSVCENFIYPTLKEVWKCAPILGIGFLARRIKYDAA